MTGVLYVQLDDTSEPVLTIAVLTHRRRGWAGGGECSGFIFVIRLNHFLSFTVTTSLNSPSLSSPILLLPCHLLYLLVKKRLYCSEHMIPKVFKSLGQPKRGLSFVWEIGGQTYGALFKLVSYTRDLSSCHRDIILITCYKQKVNTQQKCTIPV